MANSVTARFNDDCKVFVSMSDDTTVEKAVIIDADGNETDIGGGGGESDFSTADVTIICNMLGGIIISDGWWIVDNAPESYVEIDEGTTNLEFVLYKGGNKCGISGGSVSVSGDATSTPTPFGSYNINITGNCTITINDKQN